jgi:hypothetical protein
LEFKQAKGSEGLFLFQMANVSTGSGINGIGSNGVPASQQRGIDRINRYVAAPSDTSIAGAASVSVPVCHSSFICTIHSMTILLIFSWMYTS